MSLFFFFLGKPLYEVENCVSAYHHTKQHLFVLIHNTCVEFYASILIDNGHLTLVECLISLYFLCHTLSLKAQNVVKLRVLP